MGATCGITVEDATAGIVAGGGEDIAGSALTCAVLAVAGLFTG